MNECFILLEKRLEFINIYLNSIIFLFVVFWSFLNIDFEFVFEYEVIWWVLGIVG